MKENKRRRFKDKNDKRSAEIEQRRNAARLNYPLDIRMDLINRMDQQEQPEENTGFNRFLPDELDAGS